MHLWIFFIPEVENEEAVSELQNTNNPLIELAVS